MKLLKDNRAYSLSGWSEGILLSILIVIMFGLVITNMNGMYGGNNELGLGTDTTTDAFVNYQNTLADEIQGGEASFESSSGLTLKSSWGIIKSATGIIWNFFTGGWIETITFYMGLPAEVGLIFRILYFLSMGYIVLRILFKVRP